MKRRKNPPWYTEAHERADRAARYGTPIEAPARSGGFTARHDGFCWICDRTIVRDETQVRLYKGSWVCATCGGVDDE